MKDNWPAAYKTVLESEGGYTLTDIPGDAGGQTYAGISRVSNPDWDGWEYIDRKETPPEDLVQAFYKRRFWDKCRCDDLPSGVDYAVYDFAVNAGVKRASRTIQFVVNVLADGEIGPRTVAAINAMDPEEVIQKFSDAKTEFYNAIVLRNPTQTKFIKGWLNRVAHVKDVATAMT